MVVVALSMFACTSPNKVEAGKNLVVNGSFEDGLNGWTPSINTEISEITLKSHSVGSDDYTNYGASYLSMFNYTEEIAVLKQKIKIESGATYRLSAVVYVGDALTGENEKTLVGAHIGFGENVHFIQNSQVKATSGFMKYSYVFTTEFRDVTLQAVIGATGGEVKGTAYFDDIQLVKLTDDEVRELPTSAIKTLESYIPTNGGAHSILYVLLGSLALGGVLYGVWVALRRHGWRENKKETYGIVKFMMSKGALWTLLAVALGIRVFVGVLYSGYALDLQNMTGISDKIASVGFAQYYAETGYSMLPMGVYLTSLFGGLANVLGATGSWVYLIYKLPAIIVDLVTIYFIYKLAKKFIGEVGGILGGLLWAICPTILTITSAWGTLDSVLTMLVVMLFYFILDPNGMKSWARYVGIFVTLTIGVLTKIEMLWFVPLVSAFLIYNFIKKKELRKTMIIGTIASVIGFWLVSLPLTISFVGAGRVFYIWEEYFGYIATGIHYFARDNFGLYSLVGLSWSTGVRTLSIVMNLLFAILVFVFTILMYMKEKSRVNLLLLAGLTIIAGYTFGIDMSPTVLIIGLALLLAYAVVSNDWRVYLCFAIFGALSFANTTAVLTVSGVFVPFSLGIAGNLVVGGVFSIIWSILQILAFFFLVYVTYDICINEKMKQIEYIDGYDTATIWGKVTSKFRK